MFHTPAHKSVAAPAAQVAIRTELPLHENTYGERLIYGTWAPSTTRMRQEFDYEEFQSLDATDNLPRGGLRSHRSSGDYFLANGYVNR